MTITLTRKQAWNIFDSAPSELHRWEHTEPEYVAKWGHPGGLLLGGCPCCSAFETRETYVGGFWAQRIELITDYSCCGIEQCKCGQWVKWVH